MNTLDIIIIAIIGISALTGMIRGFIRTLFGLTAMLLTLVLTWIFTPSVSQFVIDETFFDEMISEKTVELLNIEEMVSYHLDTSDKGQVVRFMNDLSLPGNLIETLEENYTDQVISGFDFAGVGDYVGGIISVMAVNALVFTILFIVISVILNAIVTFLDLIARLPVLKQANRIGGLGLGLIIGVISVWIGALIISFAISIQSTEALSGLIESSILGKILYYNNPLQNFVMNAHGLLK